MNTENNLCLTQFVSETGVTSDTHISTKCINSLISILGKCTEFLSKNGNLEQNTRQLVLEIVNDCKRLLVVAEEQAN